MSLLQILFLAVVQGLTEFFPVSSSGHLVIFQVLFGLEEPQVFVDAMLHAGTLLALLAYLRKDLLAIARALGRLFTKQENRLQDKNLKFFIYLVIASVPTGIMGYFLDDFFESMFNSMRTVGGALLVTSLVLFLTKWSKEKKLLGTPGQALLIGILQGMAITPGFSRSGFTISGGLLLGWKREEATRFSFLLSIPAIMGACLYQIHKINWAYSEWGKVGAGILLSAVAGYFSLVYLARLVKKGKFYLFSFYCFGLGSSALILSFFL